MRLLKTLTVFLTVVGCSSNENEAAKTGSAGSKEWVGFNHDYANSRANVVETKISVDTASSLHELWRWDGAGVTSTPAVRGGTVYFGTWDGAVKALDAKTGAEVWTAQVQGPGPPFHIPGSPYVTEDTVYVGAFAGNLFSIDRKTGALNWPDGVPTDPDSGGLLLWSSPTVVDDLVIIGIASLQVFFAGTPLFHGSVRAFDKLTGDLRWAVPVAGDGGGVSVWSSAAVDQSRGMIYIGTGQQYGAPDVNTSDSVVAIDYKAGTLKWARQFTTSDSWTLNNGGTCTNAGVGPGVKSCDFDVGTSPNLFEAGGRTLVGAGDKKGNYYALDRDTGEIVWQAALGPGGKTGGVMATSAYHKGVIYALGNDGSSGGGGFGTSGPPKGTLYALDAATGNPNWSVPTAGCFGAVTYANGVVYFPTLLDGSTPPAAHAVNAADGSELWTEHPGQPLAGGFSVSDGIVYVGHGWNWLPTSAVPGGLVAYGL